jgi:cell wall assembly regulator SMI1
MQEPSRYRLGQRWAFKPSVAGFEDTLVIGAVIEAHPEFGWNERNYEVYVQYGDVAKASIPADYDGTILSLTDEGLDRSVTTLVASDEQLPWWWVYGRRFKSENDAPRGRSVMTCDRVSDSLPHIFQSAKQVAEDTRACQEALREHRKTFGSNASRPQPSRTVEESWKRIETWYTENAYPVGRSLAAGASDAAITQFEKEIDARLPEDFKASVRIHDGGGWEVPPCRGELLSLEGILGQWKMYSEWQASGTYAVGEDWRPSDMKGSIKPVFWNRQRIYVTDNSGDHLTIDLDPPTDGTYGQVLDHSHELGPTEVIASSWGEFLRNLVEELETGMYIYLRHEGQLRLVEELERDLEQPRPAV